VQPHSSDRIPAIMIIFEHSKAAVQLTIKQMNGVLFQGAGYEKAVKQQNNIQNTDNNKQ
jgi:hypothetical protein